MPVPHDLPADLHVPDEAFQALLDQDPELHDLHKDYLAIDKQVLIAERNGSRDEALNDLRKQRLAIKDDIERIVQHYGEVERQSAQKNEASLEDGSD